MEDALDVCGGDCDADEDGDGLYDDEDDAQEAMEARAARKERAMAAVDELTPQPPGEQQLTITTPPVAQPRLPYEEDGA